MTDPTTAELVAYLRDFAAGPASRFQDHRDWHAGAADRLEKLEAECERLRAVVQMIEDTATIETPPELRAAALKALGE